MDSGLSTVRNLLYIVLVLVLLAVATNIYVGTQLSENSEELARLGKILQDNLMTSTADQSKQLEDKLDAVNKSVQDAQADMAKQRQAFMDQLNSEAPKIIDRSMDDYIRRKAPQLERQALKQMPRQ